MIFGDVPSSLFVGFEPPPRSPGGIARYTRELLTALNREDVPNVSVHHTHVHEQLRAVAARAWAARIRTGFGATINAKVNDGSATSFHATSVLAPPRGSHPLVVTIHDTVPYTHPETLTPHGAAWHRTMIARAAFHADAIVVPTEAVAAGLTRELLRAGIVPTSATSGLGERIHVAGGAASLKPIAEEDAQQIRDAFDIGARDYIVFVGTIEPRKGLDVLVRSVAARSDVDLVIIGAQGWGNVDLRRIAHAAHLNSDRLITTGAVHDSAVAAIVQGARALVLPSSAEGFGLPLIESMNLGTPVVLSNDSALTEVAGGAGIVAPILGAEATLDDVTRILNRALDESFDRRDELVAAGHVRSAEFSWAKTATRVTEIHRQLTTRSSD